MIDCNGFTLKRVHGMIRTYSLFSFCVLSLRREKYCAHLFYIIRNKMTGHFLTHICILQHNNILQKTLKIFFEEILKDWVYLCCKNYIDYVNLVKVCLFCHIF